MKTFILEQIQWKLITLFLMPCQNSEKSNDPILRIHWDRCQEGREGWTEPFQRILLITAGGKTSTTAVDWHLKVKNKKHDVVGLTKNYCITVNMETISSIHKLIPESHELNDQAHFWICPLKNHWNNFYLPWICTSIQKSVHSIISSLRYSQF